MIHEVVTKLSPRSPGGASTKRRLRTGMITSRAMKTAQRIAFWVRLFIESYPVYLRTDHRLILDHTRKWNRAVAKAKQATGAIAIAVLPIGSNFHPTSIERGIILTLQFIPGLASSPSEVRGRTGGVGRQL